MEVIGRAELSAACATLAERFADAANRAADGTSALR